MLNFNYLHLMDRLIAKAGGPGRRVVTLTDEDVKRIRKVASESEENEAHLTRWFGKLLGPLVPRSRPSNVVVLTPAGNRLHVRGRMAMPAMERKRRKQVLRFKYERRAA